MNNIYLILAIVFSGLAILLLVHHRFKHRNDSGSKAWFKTSDIFNGNWSHEKFITVFVILAIIFYPLAFA